MDTPMLRWEFGLLFVAMLCHMEENIAYLVLAKLGWKWEPGS